MVRSEESDLEQRMEDGLLKVLGVVNGSELRVGDVLIRINGQPVKGRSTEEATSMYGGQAPDVML